MREAGTGGYPRAVRVAPSIASLLAFGVALVAGSARAAAPPTEGPGPVRLLMLDLEAGPEVEPELVRTIAGLISVEISALRFGPPGACPTGGEPACRSFDLVTGQDVRRAVELEASKQALDCDAAASCLAEVAGALGADLVIFGDVGRLGSVLVVNLSLFDSAEVRTPGRAALRARDLEELPDQIAPKLLELLGPTLQERGLGALLGTRAGAPGAARAGASALPWTVAGIGGAAALGGLAAAVTGLLPWMGHGLARADIEGYEQQGLSALEDAKRRQQDQIAYRDAWGSWGALTAGIGAATLAVGVVVAGAGVAWGLVEEEP